MFKILSGCNQILEKGRLPISCLQMTFFCMDTILLYSRLLFHSLPSLVLLNYMRQVRQIGQRIQQEAHDQRSGGPADNSLRSGHPCRENTISVALRLFEDCLGAEQVQAIQELRSLRMASSWHLFLVLSQSCETNPRTCSLKTKISIQCVYI